MRMINNYLAGEDVTNNSLEMASGFEDTKKLKFSTLLIVASSEEDIKVGDRVKVPVNAGQDDEINNKEVRIIHRNDIIRIL